MGGVELNCILLQFLAFVSPLLFPFQGPRLTGSPMTRLRWQGVSQHTTPLYASSDRILLPDKRRNWSSRSLRLRCVPPRSPLVCVSHPTQWASTASLACSIAGDAIITGAMCYYLHLSRSGIRRCVPSSQPTCRGSALRFRYVGRTSSSTS